jgi:hypothetical protein
LDFLASSFFLGVHANIDLLNILMQLVMSMKDILIAKIIPNLRKMMSFSLILLQKKIQVQMI